MTKRRVSVNSVAAGRVLRRSERGNSCNGRLGIQCSVNVRKEFKQTLKAQCSSPYFTVFYSFRPGKGGWILSQRAETSAT